MSHAAELPHLDEESALNATDAACLADLHAALAQHGKEARFGVGLLHRHFDLRTDEQLVETVDEASRTLTTRPMDMHQLPRRGPRHGS